MNPALSAALNAMGADARNELQALLTDIVAKDLPAIVAAEAGSLPAAYGPIVSIVFQALYPQLQTIAQAKIAALFPGA